jgi:hypothetical protein
MSAARRTVLIGLAAVLGIALAAAITWGTSQLVSQRIGLASEPLTAGQRLLPAVASTPAPTTRSPRRPAPTSSTSSRTRSSPAPSTTTSPTPSPPTQSRPAPLPAAPEVAPVESAPAVVRGSGGESGDSGSRRDD